MLVIAYISSPLLVRKRKQYFQHLPFHVTIVNCEIGSQYFHDVIHPGNSTPKCLLDFIHSLRKDFFACQVSGCGLCHKSCGRLRRRLLDVVWTPKRLRGLLLLLLLLLLLQLRSLLRWLSIWLPLWLRLPLLNIVRESGILLRLLFKLLKTNTSMIVVVCRALTAISSGAKIAVKISIVPRVTGSAVKVRHVLKINRMLGFQGDEKNLGD
jgi:hypothetical protein